MIDIVKSLFQQLNFGIEQHENLIGLPSGSFSASFNSSHKEEYFLVLNVSHLNQLKEPEENLSQSLEDLMFNWKNLSSGVAKNTNLLIVWQALSEEEVENNKKLIFELEEDPYDFKKYVLFYTEPELKEFSNRFSENVYNLETLQTELNNSDSFIAFKSYLKSKNPITESIFLCYSLLSRIFIKVPILKTTNLHQDLYDLQNVIDTRILQKGLVDLQQKVLEFDENTLEVQPIDELINSLLDE